MIQIIRPLIFIIFAVFIGTGTVRANEEPVKSEETETAKSFNAGKYVIEHVSDAYEWHIATFGETHISIPLPIILYSSNKGWNFFMSSRFHHGHETYNNFRIESEGQHEGKIVEVNESGEVVSLPVDLSITKVVAGIFVSVIVLLLIFLNIAKSAKEHGNQAPKGLQNLFEPIILFIRDEVAKPAIGENKFERF
ncbi:MAG: F0F1 ATP synthase subunit A, partial [Bacteroidota bacterium]|nr:F0F1 ATP synthase subunit A [Bacteroidota bacterium]